MLINFENHHNKIHVLQSYGPMKIGRREGRMDDCPLVKILSHISFNMLALNNEETASSK